MTFHGIRGAISVERDEAHAIHSATRTLLGSIVLENQVAVSDIGGVFFTATPDLSAAYPATAAREMGWTHVPLLCAQEMAVRDSLPRCIRVMVMWNTERSPEQIRHIYLGRARALRPDLVDLGGTDAGLEKETKQ